MSSRVATHERMIASQETRGSSDRTFGLVFTAVFTVVGLLPLLGGAPVRGWSLAVAAAFLVVTVLRPRALAPLNRAWTWIGLQLHRVANPIVMGVIFYGVVTPIGMVLRLAGKDLLRLRFDGTATTYWIERQPPGPEPGTMRRQF